MYQKGYKLLLIKSLSIKTTQERKPTKDNDARALQHKL
jgi:hypothetical protein